MARQTKSSETDKSDLTELPPLTAVGLMSVYNIDKIDEKILQDLLRDGRKNFTIIAKEAKVSKDVIWKHYNIMKKAGIIAGATIQHNPEDLGYEAIVTILLNVESQSIDDFIEKFSIPDVDIYRQYNSRFNVGAISRLKEIRDLDRIKGIISKNKAVNEIKTYIWTDVRNTPENIIKSTSDPQTATSEEKKLETKTNAYGKPMEPDDLDMQIIEKLTKDGRVSFRKIAFEVDSSTDTVARRYQGLIKNNIIKVVIQIKPELLGFQAILDTTVALTMQSKTNEIVDKLSKITGVSYVLKITGDSDLQIVALVKDCRDIMRIDDEILKIKNVKRTEGFLRQFRHGYDIWPRPRQHITTF